MSNIHDGGQLGRNEFESGEPVRRESGGRRSGAKRRFFLVVPFTFLALKVQLVTGERFCDSQYILVSFLFAVLLLTARRRPCPAICKSDGYAPVPYGVGATDNGRNPLITLQSLQKSLSYKSRNELQIKLAAFT